MQYFLGRYEYAMDARGRVPVPPRYRDLFIKGAVLNQGPDPCLRLFTAESFEQQAALYTSAPAIERGGRMTRHAFFANSFTVEPDRQGRILVPAPLRVYAGLEGTVIVSGAGEWIEVWSPNRFETEMSAAIESQEPTA
ncbi:MAG: cell division/cell wall cluster transcriptional repressor MraZ [Dehalococcoidia bacterium]